MSIDNKTRQAAFRQRMRLAGKKSITLWVSPEEEQAIRAILNRSADSDEETDPPPVTTDETSSIQKVPRRRASIKKR
ncbi:MAG: hypothetical protein U1A72_12570 [Sulfuritalea sp.]|nr:hypothetical protein [Sulfuritalea sp.]